MSPVTRASGRRAGVVWGVAAGAYAVAVLHRGAFGVAGVEAADRFGVNATVLSTFVVVQVAVYAALQVPVGLLLDRLGSRTLIAGGAALMALGQLLLGAADTLGPAYVARVLIGAGDAATFISVVRLVAVWFPARRVPLFTQLTGLVGQVGQIVASVPLVLMLGLVGWTSTFVGLAAVGVLAAVAVVAVVRDQPPGTVSVRSSGSLTYALREVLHTPGTWLGFWSHCISQFSLAVFVLLWGFPFLTVAQRLDPTTAGWLLTLCVLSSMASGPVAGALTGNHPLRRSWIVLGTAGATVTAWTAVLLQPGHSPRWLLMVLVVVLGAGGSVSLVGVDFARTFNPPQRFGAATGLVNMGGFAMAVVGLLAVGAVLDLAAAHGAPPLSVAAFRPAFAVLALPWLVALAGVLVTRRSTRRVMAAQGVRVPPVREALARRRDARTQ